MATSTKNPPELTLPAERAASRPLLTPNLAPRDPTSPAQAVRQTKNRPTSVAASTSNRAEVLAIEQHRELKFLDELDEFDHFVSTL